MKKRILIPTDFSKNAWNAIAYAADLYKREAVDFYIVHAFGKSRSSTADQQAEIGLQKTLKLLEIKTTYPNHTYFTLALDMLPLRAIKETVERKDIELVVMGTKGETDDKDVFYGSNTVDAMEKVRNCPVLAIPGDITYQDPNEIVFPTSYKTHYKRRELRYLFEISRITNAPIRILHVQSEKNLSPLKQSNKELLENCLDGTNYSFHWLENVSVQEGLFNFVSQRNSGMIAFINKKHQFFGSIFSNPLVKQLGMYATIPVLALHDLRN
ncbi:MAG: universal stress protein [Altibacter sp.]|uniref:universal stress protein n=1 Tax=Altibacter sp. TaxID=2024823 RepID=UPI001E14B655|nr:universal stress protein [Altibacter sp.]MBZ0327980.1 universal stress protein [Altibacter sp.]